MSENKNLIIIGSDKPVIGTKEMYSVSSVNDWLDPLKLIKNPLQVPKTHWEVMVETKTGWRKGGSDKEGQTIPFTFGQKSLFHKGIKIIARQGEFDAELIVHPQRAKEPKITRVELLDANYKAIPKGKKLSYKDTIIARAYCVEMFGMNIAFTLWEDDAQGEGHNAKVNALNKINPAPILSRVNEKGVAEAVFRLPFYTMAVLIANAQTASGDKNEGATHEYYVTADIVSKHIQKASLNVNVVNPTHNPEPPRKREFPKGNTPSSEKPKPQNNSSKFPVTTGGKKSDDPQGKILSAEFVDNNGNRLHSLKVGTTVRIKIVAKEMKDKKVKVKIWEEDNIKWTNDLIFEKDCILIGDNNYINNVQLTKQMFNKAKDGGSDSARQDYFIEVIHHDTSVTSEVMPVNEDAEPTKVESGRSPAIVREPKPEKRNCGGKYCIDKSSAPSELMREINIRLAGFGGNVPTDRFTDRTEKMIKQFQRDYMKVPETGKVCGNVLKAIDEFQSKFTVDFTEIKCKCKKCTGFGDGTNKGKYLKDKKEAYHRYEYPGIHRSLLSSIRAVKFYLRKDGRFGFNKVNSGYRCRFHEEYLKKPTTNHMGKALDLHFNDKNGRTKKTSDMETIREDIFHKYLGAKWDWKERNIFNLESTEKGAKTWVHYDVREFDHSFLEDKFFVKTLQELNGKSIVALALELNYSNTCKCIGEGIVANTKEKDTTKKSYKYKWAHSEFGNLIAMRESSDNYNKCNKTKGGFKEVNNLNLADLTVEEIQEKQKNRDLFAVGRYQLIPITFNDAISNLKLNLNDKMDKDKQDEIFDEYLIKIKRPKIISYLEGNGNLEDAMYSAAQEWASIAVEKGKRISDKVTKDKKGNVISREARFSDGTDSYYQGDGLNQAHIMPEQIKNVLINSKNANK
ncbi:hypothetical protein DRF65_13135 [Chryseobacterium pennae]|uniref:Uncharacterized protein n=1 Tax=Chryseobacterium pennae TaxID=2258962 RepID=A0A3D9C7V9_9FLAO|nr:peptidoglycan-binding domain-containing protein [Chryseobacterium pennae]REC61965.1 hypothetical protein DRF65_13135 [Chryseobacterium pennae]